MGPGDGGTLSRLSWDGRLGIGDLRRVSNLDVISTFLFVCLVVYYILEAICLTFDPVVCM